MNPIASRGSKLMVSNGTNNVDILPTFYIQLYQLPGTKFTARDLRFPVGQNRSWKTEGARKPHVRLKPPVWPRHNGCKRNTGRRRRRNCEREVREKGKAGQESCPRGTHSRSRGGRAMAEEAVQTTDSLAAAQAAVQRQAALTLAGPRMRELGGVDKV